MRRVIFYVFLAGLLVACAAATGGRLATYEPKSTAEAGIKKTLMNFENAYDARDLEGCLSCFHKNAQYQITVAGGQMTSMEYLPLYFKDLWSTYDIRFHYGAPDIEIDEEQAIVKIDAHTTLMDSNSVTRASTTRNTYTMVRERDRWLIMKRVAATTRR